MVSQQNLLRIVMERHGLTRDAFCAQYSVTRRSLDAWLLPTTSKGFRPAPSELRLRLGNVLEGGIHLPNHIQEPLGDGFDISLEVTGHPIQFPRVFLREITHPPLNRNTFEPLEGPNEISSSFHVKEYSQYALLDGWTEKISLVRQPPQIRSPIWLVITHHRSEAEANGFRDAIDICDQFMLSDIEECPGQTFEQFHRVNNELFSILATRARDFYPHSLFIFRGKTLAFDAAARGWYADYLTKVICESGEILDRLPWERHTEMHPYFKDAKERRNKLLAQTLAPIERTVVKRFMAKDRSKNES